MTELKKLRIKSLLSQEDCAKLLNISLRSYKDYENDETKSDTSKYKYLFDKLFEIVEITETKGVLTKENITSTCAPIFKKYKVDCCYLFGSYAKGKAKGTSDVDLLISANCTGLKFYELAELLREKLHKKVDLLDIKQLNNNQELLAEILKTGVKIYG